MKSTGMENTIAGEVWKEIKFNFEFENNIRVEISNLGRIKTHTRFAKTNIINGSVVQGYRVLRLKLFKKRTEEEQHKLVYYRNQISKLYLEIKKYEKLITELPLRDSIYYEKRSKLDELKDLQKGLKSRYEKELRRIELNRTINYGNLVHRLVAEYFIEKPSADHLFVTHLNYNKMDNRQENLQWMTQAELTEHQKASPYFNKNRKSQKNKRNENSKVFKLTSSKVMIIKKRLNQGATLKSLAKRFKVSEMQISRIKRGENWNNIPAAS